jgi:hypothetical protein
MFEVIFLENKNHSLASTSETSKCAARKSAGVEIAPMPFGIIFNILGLPGGKHQQ